MPKRISFKTMHVMLWIAQVLLAVLLLSGTIMKFQPIEKIAGMMPWTGELAVWKVRMLGVVDLLGALGLTLPVWLRIKPEVTVWAAYGVVLLMLAAILFHVSRGESDVIGINIFMTLAAGFVAWGRSSSINTDSLS